MITLSLKNHSGENISSRSHEVETYLAFKNYSYQTRDFIEILTDETFLWVQLDEALAHSLVYIPEGQFIYEVVIDEQLKRAYSPKIFSGERHYLRVKKATKEEVSARRNLALNVHAQKDFQGAYPHAFANVETRNDSTFFARNAIDGMIANESHGSYPYQSWGINQQADAEMTIDFGRQVKIDEMAFVFRGDYPHDSFWTNVTVEFSDTSTLTFATNDRLERQFFSFAEKVTSSVKLKQLIKHHDDSPFPALTQWEVYGTEA